jgi:non-ribosomal peptide synthetase component E (peptide arylation enzyme)
VEGPGEGYIVFRRPWPGMMRTVYGDHARFQATYFSRFPGYYMSGDGARRDADGYIWITGRTLAESGSKSVCLRGIFMGIISDCGTEKSI